MSQLCQKLFTEAMCSLTESALDPEMRRKEVGLVGREVRCKKCGVEECSVNLRVRDTYCRECFLTAVHHKVGGFRKLHNLSLRVRGCSACSMCCRALCSRQGQDGPR